MMELLQVPQIPLPPDPGSHMAMGLTDPMSVLITIVVMGTFLLLGWPLVRALARRLEGGAASKELLAEIDGLRSRVLQLEEGQGRMGELEERVDFAERLLAQAREPDRLQR